MTTMTTNEKPAPDGQDAKGNPVDHARPTNHSHGQPTEDLRLVRRAKSPLLSLVVPVHNEEHGIWAFLNAAIDALSETNCPYELVFVNDGSEDRTLEVLRAAKTQCPQIRIVTLSRNFGKDAALTAGLDNALGDVVIPLDVDLQDPPSLIPKFLEQWREGYDVVYGVRVERKAEGAYKRLSAACFYKVFNFLSDRRIPENAGDFRLMDRRVVDQINTLREKTRFMKALMDWPGYRSIGVPFERPNRTSGRTSWNFWKLWNFALDGITSFSTLPLRLWFYVGAVICCFSLVYAISIVTLVLNTGRDVPGYASLIVAVMFFGGIQLLSIGLVGEYIGRILQEIKGRPIYLIDRIE